MTADEAERIDAARLSPQDWADLRVFVEVGSQLSFTRAAQRLFVSQSTVSRQLSRLERRLGKVLLNRTSRTVELSPLGKALFNRLTDAVEAIEETLHSGGVATRMRRSIVATCQLPQSDVLVRLRQTAPEVEWMLHGLTVDQGLAAVTDGTVGHLATLWCPRMRPAMLAAAVEFHAVVPLSWRVSIPADHMLAGASPLTLSDLSDAHWAVPAERDVESDLLRACADAGFRPDVRLRTMGAHDSVDTGLVSLVGPWQRETGASRVLPCEGLPPLQLVVMSRPDRQSGRPLQALVDAVTALADGWCA